MNRGITILHTGDTHLGYQQYHQPEREQDFMDAFVQTIDAAIERGVDAYVHGGDLFQDANPSPQVQREVLDQLNRLGEHNIPFLGVVGNHDRATDGQWLDVFEQVDRATHLGLEPVIIGDTAFYGLDHMGQARRQRFSYDFEPADDVDYTILVAHGQFAPLTAGTWDLQEVLHDSSIEFDAVLLGDEHDRIETTIDDTPVTYAGSTERTATDQEEERTFNLVTTGKQINIDTVELDTREFFPLEIELAPDEGKEEIIDRIDLYENLEGAVVEVRIKGDGDQFPTSEIEQYVENEYDAFYTIARDKREFEGDVESLDVSFSDPDKEIEERIGALGLSETVRGLERLVRDEQVAKTNLRKHTKTEVENVLEDGDIDALEPAEIPDDPVQAALEQEVEIEEPTDDEDAETHEESEKETDGTSDVEPDQEENESMVKENQQENEQDNDPTQENDDGSTSLSDFV